MSHFTVWLLLVAGGLAGAILGLSHVETAANCAYFSGVALLVHWLYETR